MIKLQRWQQSVVLGLGAAAIAIHFASCVSIPKGAKAVSPFRKDDYLGKWYEIARMDFKFEKNLNQVTATYSLNADGSIKVDNKGYNYVKNEWRESIGKAKFVKDETIARLKVSFFGPFYAGYNVIAIDQDYQFALIAGNDLGYLWILSREKTIPAGVRDQYLKQAEALGYDTKNWYGPSSKQLPLKASEIFNVGERKINYDSHKLIIFLCLKPYQLMLSSLISMLHSRAILKICYAFTLFTALTLSLNNTCFAQSNADSSALANSSAKFELGIAGGLSVNQFTDGQPQTGTNTGFVVGLSLDYKIYKQWSLQVEANFLQQGGQLLTFKDDTRLGLPESFATKNVRNSSVHLNSLDIPLLIKYTVPLQKDWVPQFYAGGSYAYNFNVSDNYQKSGNFVAGGRCHRDGI